MSKLALTKKYGAYPEYKDSEIKWVEAIPTHWEVVKAGQLFEKREEKPVSDDEIVTAFRDGTVTLRKNRREDGFTMATAEIGYQRIHQGDLVIHGMDAFAGAIGVSDSTGKSSPVYSACVPRRDADTRYFSYLLRHMSKSGYIFALAKGIRERSTEFRFKEFKTLFIAEPPYEEQRKIADFLDEKVVTIDHIIEKKQRQIELLKEKRAAVINYAVTKGLNPKVKLADSSVEWMGSVPSSWKLTKIKPIIKTIRAGVWGDEPKKNDSDIRCLRVADFDYEYLTTVEPKTVRNNPKLPQAKKLRDGDILFEKSGGGEKTPVGRAVLYSGEGGVTCANFIDVVRVDEQKVLPAYLVFCLAALYDGRLNTKYIKQNTGIQNIKAASYFSEQIPLPPKNEQEEIVQYLQDYLDKDRLATEKLNKTITLLQEFKSSLISHVVTGKIKV